MKKRNSKLLNWGVLICLLLSALYIILAGMIDLSFLGCLACIPFFFVYRHSAKKAERMIKEQGFLDYDPLSKYHDPIRKAMHDTSRDHEYPDAAAGAALSFLLLSLAVCFCILISKYF